MGVKNKKKYVRLLVLLVIALILTDYYYFDKFLNKTLIEKETVIIKRVIDGDTIELESGERVRLLGINTPEKGEWLYEEAKKFLNNSIFNKSVFLEQGRENKDLYGRSLRYIFIESNDSKNEKKSVNEQLIENGYANYYYPTGYDQYSYRLINAWKRCVEKEINLCEKSKDKCADCIKLKTFDAKNEKIVLKNECGYSCNLTYWTIKDEGRKKFIFPYLILDDNREVTIKVGNGKNTENELYWKGEEYVWTKTGDTLFLRDDKEKLVMWKGY